MKRITILAAAGALVSLALAAPVWAATFVVTKTADTNDGVCNADCSLREAIIRANAHAGADVIRFQANGVFFLRSNGDDTAAIGDLDVTDTVEIIGNGQANTIVDAHHNDRVFHIFSPTTIRRLTVRGGSNESAPGGFGAGIMNESNLSVYDSVIANNTTSFGGAIYNGDDIVDFQRTIVDANSASFGAAIYNDGDINDGVFSDNVFRHNSAGFGGAIYNATDIFTPSFTGNTFAENSAGFGGAIYNAAAIQPASFSHNTFDQNSAGFGGAFYNGGDFGSHLATGNVFSANTASVGGAIYNGDDFGFGMRFRHNTFRANTAPGGAAGAFFNAGDFFDVTFSDNRFEHNTAAAGGGFANDAIISEDAAITNNVFSRNSATGDGGGFYNDGTFGDAVFSGNTFDRNTAGDDGGGFFNVGRVCDAGTCAGDEADFSGNTFSFNLANDDGGGLYNGGQFAAPIVNSTFSGNRAVHGDGGGVWHDGNLTDFDLVHLTLSGNGADGAGGGIFAEDGAVNLRAVIVANNHLGGDCAETGGNLVSLGFNIDTDDTCDLTALGDQAATNPQLGPLGFFGGPTQTHLLRRNSHAIDHETAGCPPPSTDQRGVSRPQNGAGPHGHDCDVGAVEMRPGEAPS